jgi:hypothetical protein
VAQCKVLPDVVKAELDEEPVTPLGRSILNPNAKVGISASTSTHTLLSPPRVQNQIPHTYPLVQVGLEVGYQQA